MTKSYSVGVLLFFLTAEIVDKSSSFSPAVNYLQKNFQIGDGCILYAKVSNEKSGRRKAVKLVRDSKSWLNSQQSSTETTALSGDNGGNILEDSTGHISGLLAARIFNWEQRSREKQNLPQVDYSIRSGLRLVEQLVEEILEERRGMIVHNRDNARDSLYSDLIQEGLAGLLDAMQHYRDEDHQELGFARYASTEIRKQLDKSLSQNLSNRPMRLPRSVINTVEEAKTIAQEMRNGARRPTLDQVAQQLHIPSAQLRDYLNLVKLVRPPTLSMESTVEITHPLLDESVLFQDWDEWEKNQESMMTTSSAATVQASESVASSTSTVAASFTSTSSGIAGTQQQYQNPSQQESTMSGYYLDDPDLKDLEGDDQAWIVQQEAQYGSGTLSDVIPDLQQPSPDDLVLQEMIRHDVSEFLEGTLSTAELEVIRSVFGLDTGKQSTLKRTASQLDMTTEDVSVLLAGGLQKLRESYAKLYVEPYLEDNNDWTVDSV